MNNDETLYTESNVDKLLSCHPQNEEHFSFLLRLMQRNVVVPFLGAGISKNYGYPTWREFLENEAKAENITEISTLLDSNEYEKAASKLHERLDGSMEFVLMQTFGDHKYKNASNNPEIEFIPKLFRNLILTTNFDEVAELLYAKVNGEYIEKLTPMTMSNTKVIQKRIACGEPTLIKLHGDIATREFVLTEEEYNATYGIRVLDSRLPLPKFLHDALLSRIILFLGCSLQDDRTLQVVEQSRIDGSMSFALLELPSETNNDEVDPWKPKLESSAENQKRNEALAERQVFLNAHNIIPIWYPHKKHESLKIFLMALAHRLNPEQRLSITIAHDTLNRLLKDGEISSKEGNVQEASHCFTEAEKVLEQNYSTFTVNDQIQALKKVKNFIDTNGYAIERRDIIKKLIRLTNQELSYNRLDLVICYHDLGYTYERYQYYKLMLKAMIRSNEILEKVKNDLSRGTAKKDELNSFYDIAALIYTSLGYAYFKNEDNENAKIWFLKADELNKKTDINISKKSRAFILNGLYRYYMIFKDTDNAINTLDKALKLRKELYNSSNDAERILPQHIINSHSNKIHVYLEEDLFSKAEDEYKACMDEIDIEERLWNFPDARHRILEDYGDILQATERFSEAYYTYKKALQHRRYLHVATDIIAANLYFKMASSLEHMNCLDKALEYLIQSYVLKRKMLGEKHPNLISINSKMEDLREKLSYNPAAIEQRIEIQSEFLEYRYDERIDNLEDMLIQEFEL